MRYMVSYKNKIRRAWDLGIILLAFITTMLQSLNVAFKPFGKWFDVYDGFVFVIYLLDIIVKLRTTYLNNFGEEITDKKQIAKNYIYSLDFVVDVLSIIYNPAT